MESHINGKGLSVSSAWKVRHMLQVTQTSMSPEDLAMILCHVMQCQILGSSTPKVTNDLEVP